MQCSEGRSLVSLDKLFPGGEDTSDTTQSDFVTASTMLATRSKSVLTCQNKSASTLRRKMVRGGAASESLRSPNAGGNNGTAVVQLDLIYFFCTEITLLLEYTSAGVIDRETGRLFIHQN